MDTSVVRFTAFRRNVSSSGRHEEHHRNADDQPQYEGVIFTGGRVVIHWLTPSGGYSMFDSLALALGTHGHPELGTDIVWHDGEMPEEWKRQLVAYAEHRQAEYHEAGKPNVTLLTEHDDAGNLLSVVLKEPGGDVIDTIYPVTP